MSKKNLYSLIIMWVIRGQEIDQVLEKQTIQYQLTQTIIILTSVCLFLMWAMTYMAQMHPLVNPQKE
jgi:V-type H+-transporting ATPase subunit e